MTQLAHLSSPGSFDGQATLLACPAPGCSAACSLPGWTSPQPTSSRSVAAGSSPGLQCCVDLEFRACSSTAGEPGGIHIVERAGRRRRC